MKTIKSSNNNDGHLYGLINSVDILDSKNEGRKVIRLFVNVSNDHKNKEGEIVEEKPTKLNAVLFTSNKETIAKFEKLQADLKAYHEDKENNKVQSMLSANYFLQGSEFTNAEGEKRWSTNIILKEASVDLGVKKAENEVRNSVSLVGNIQRVNQISDKAYAITIRNTHEFEKGEEKQRVVSFVTAFVNEANMKETFAALKSGELSEQDFIRVGGRLGVSESGEPHIIGNTVKLLKKNAVEQEAGKEVKAEPEKKAAAKKAEPKKAEEKKAATKKAVSRKKTAAPKI